MSLGTGQSPPRDQPTQVAPADPVDRQQHHRPGRGQRSAGARTTCPRGQLTERPRALVPGRLAALARPRRRIELGQAEQLVELADAELRPVDQPQSDRQRGDVPAHRTRHAVAVGQRQRPQPERLGLLRQLLRMRRALEEREVALDPQGRVADLSHRSVQQGVQEPPPARAVVIDPGDVAGRGLGEVIVALDGAGPPAAADPVRPVHADHRAADQAGAAEP